MRRKLIPILGMAAVLSSTALLSPAGLSAAGEPSDEPTLQVDQVPVEMDASNQAGWWRPHAEYNGSTYLAFNSPDAAEDLRHEVHLAKQTASGEWDSGCVLDASGACATFPDDIGHNQPSIAVDGDGYIHAFVSMHNNLWQYVRSAEPESVTNLVDRSDEMPDGDVAVTYPVAATAPNGDIYVVVRTDDGDGYSGRLYHWDLETQSWSLIDVFAREGGFTPYPDDVQVDRRGNVHILWQWARGGPSGSRYFGSYLVYEPREDRFRTIRGNEAEVPATTTDQDVVYEPGEGTTQQAKFALTNTSVPILAGIGYRYRPEGSDHYEVRWAWWDREDWMRETVDDGLPAGTTPTIGVTHHGAVARIYYIKPTACDHHRVEGGGLYVAEHRFAAGRPRGAEWRVSWLGGTAAVERLSAETLPDGTDSLYLAAPREGNPITDPSLYLATLERTGSPGAQPGWVELDEPDRTNVAYGTDVTASSTWDETTVAECVTDGNFWAEESRWISAADDPSPEITVDLNDEVPVSEIQVHSGRYAGTDDIESTFAVDVRTGGSWEEIAQITGNELSPAIVVPPADTTADQIRLRLPEGTHRLYEVEVYTDLGAQPLGLSTSTEPGSLAFPGDSAELRIALINRTAEPIEGTVDVELPDGWSATADTAEYHLGPYGTDEAIVTITSPGDAPSHGDFEIVLHGEHTERTIQELVIREGIVYVSDGEPFYTETGPWADSLLPGHDGSLSRFSEGPDATATWTAELRDPGPYNVYAWYPANQNTTTEAQYTITHADGQSTTVLNQRDTPDQWNLLGTWDFAAGNDNSVTVEALDGVALRTGAIWFEAVEDPTDAPATGLEDHDRES